MKPIIYSVLFCFLVISCKKETPSSATNSPSDASPIHAAEWSRIRLYLVNHLPDSLFQKLDTTSGVLTTERINNFYRLRFLDQPMERRFLLLTTDTAWHVTESSIVALDTRISDDKEVSGRIRVRTLNDQPLLDSKITDGFVEALQPAQTGRVHTLSLEEAVPMVETLPVFIVTPGQAGDAGLYISLSTLTTSGGINGMGGNSAAGGGGGTKTYSRVAVTSPIVRLSDGGPLTITVETSNARPAISLKDFLQCFTAVPDAGASYRIDVLVDLPVNDDPTQFFNQGSGAIGHVFLDLTKSNGAVAVSQYIGFTATQPFAAFVGGAVPSKLVDNGGHKYNARLSTTVSAAGFASAVAVMQNQSAYRYDLQNYNCVDYTLGVINSVRGSYPLSINQYMMPGVSTPMSTPEALYSLLQTMSAPGSPEASHISVGGIGYAAASHGPCN